MPRATDLNEELAKLEQAREDNPALKHQYAVRIGVNLALAFIRDCINRGELPSTRLTKIMEEYYADPTPESESGGLPEIHARAADAILAEMGRGVDREDVILSTFLEFAPQKLEQLRKLNKSIQMTA